MSAKIPCCEPVGSKSRSTCDTTTLENVGEGLDPWVDGTGPNPFELRRTGPINDGTDMHGRGTLAFWTDGSTNRVDLPRFNDQQNTSLSVAGSFITLWEHTFPDDSSGANVAGRDGEDWWVVWSVKICGDPNNPQVDASAVLESHQGGTWVLREQYFCRPIVGRQPSWPITRNNILTNTEWSNNNGLRLRIRVGTTSFFVANVFEDPSVHLYRENQALNV